jgi:hypothetical protein
MNRGSVAIFAAGLCCLPITAASSLDINFVNKSVVFFFASSPSGEVLRDRQDATGFLITVPSRKTPAQYFLLITARHVVDPMWAGCATSNPERLFVRVSKLRSGPQDGAPDLSYLPVDLTQNGTALWTKNSDDNVDVAVLKAPRELSSGDYDVRFIKVRNFGKREEIAKIGVGSQVASTGLVPGLEGRQRNYPIFKFGRIASIPDETAVLQCGPHSRPRSLWVWWIGMNLVPGNSGSPILFDPIFPPGSDVSVGEPRAMIIGLQSLAVGHADLAGMTPAKYILDTIARAVPEDADLTLGVPPS